MACHKMYVLILFFIQKLSLHHENVLNLLFDLIKFRDYNKAVYGKRTLHQETYYQPRGTYKAIQGAPTPYDISCIIDRRINGKLKKGTGGIVL